MRSLLKTLHEKEKKMLETSIFSFSHNIIYPVRDKFHHPNHIELSSADALHLGESKNLSFGLEISCVMGVQGDGTSAQNVLTLYQMTKF